MGHLPSKSGGLAYRRLHRRLLRPVFSNVVINKFTATTISASERYMRCTIVSLFIIFCEYMFRCYLFPFILLFSTSSMFELHVVVSVVVMLNILELIMEIVPNYPTLTTPRLMGKASVLTSVSSSTCAVQSNITQSSSDTC
jgi:hypothetical protein